MKKSFLLAIAILAICSVNANATSPTPTVDPSSSIIRGMACGQEGATALNYNHTEILYCLQSYWRLAATANLPKCQQAGQVATTDGVNINCVDVLPPVCKGAGHFLQFDGTVWLCVDINGLLVVGNTITPTVGANVSAPVPVPPTNTPAPSSQGDQCHLSSSWDNLSLGQNRNQSRGW